MANVEILIMFKRIGSEHAYPVKIYEYSEANVKKARNAIDRLDNKYGSYAHQLKYRNIDTGEIRSINTFESYKPELTENKQGYKQN